MPGAGDYYERLRAIEAAKQSKGGPRPWRIDDPSVDPIGRLVGEPGYRRWSSTERDGGLATAISQRFGPSAEPESQLGHHFGCHCRACKGGSDYETVKAQRKAERILGTDRRTAMGGLPVTYTVGSPEPAANLQPALPAPDPGTLERLSQPEPRKPAPGSKAAECVTAGHDVVYRENAQRWHCRTCNAARQRQKRTRAEAPARGKRRLLARLRRSTS